MLAKAEHPKTYAREPLLVKPTLVKRELRSEFHPKNRFKTDNNLNEDKVLLPLLENLKV